MTSLVQTQRPVWSAGIHVRQVALHLLIGEHVDLFQAERLENVVLEVVVEFLAGCAFDELPSPVDVDAVLPGFSGLVHQRLGQVVMIGAGELIEALRAGPIDQTLVEERIAKSSWPLISFIAQIGNPIVSVTH